jgi:hypothetical protein
MPNGILRVLSLICLIGAVPAASAQESGAVPIIGGEQAGMTSLDFDVARDSFFYQNDRDGDFALSFQEMSNAMIHGGGRLFDGYDLDGDGLISYDEYVQSGNDLFKSLDSDGDGILSTLEM